jgi:CRISPR system Cascade subunit CasD
MQSWGIRSRWDVRDTGLEPTKSGVIGLIGCAIGLNRCDPEVERLDRDLRFGVRIDRPGVISTDYHTVTGYHRTAAGEFKHSGGTAKSLLKAQEYDESTIVSSRDYLHDAVFLVGLETSSERTQSLRDALAAPHWPLYLGRKSCPPVRPLLYDTTEFNDLETALSSRMRHHRAEKGKLTAYIEDAAGELERQDALRLNQLRMYEFRRCKYLEVDPPCISLS